VSKKLKWRGLLILACIAVALIYLTPTISKKLPPWWPNVLPGEKINLGLDLRGGMHLVLEVQSQRAVESHLERMVEDIKYTLRKSKTRYQGLKRSGPDRIALTLLRDADQRAVEDMVARDFQDLSLEPGASGQGSLTWK